MLYRFALFREWVSLSICINFKQIKKAVRKIMFKFICSVSLSLMLLFIFIADNSFAQIFFEDDFESGKIDKVKWEATGGWKVVDSKGEKGLGRE